MAPSTCGPFRMVPSLSCGLDCLEPKKQYLLTISSYVALEILAELGASSETRVVGTTVLVARLDTLTGTLVAALDWAALLGAGAGVVFLGTFM